MWLELGLQTALKWYLAVGNLVRIFACLLLLSRVQSPFPVHSSSCCSPEKTSIRFAPQVSENLNSFN
jgi:hypothetical protein